MIVRCSVRFGVTVGNSGWLRASSVTGSHPRAIHTAAVLQQNKLLKKLLNKSKKKTWYDSPPPTLSPVNLPKKKDHEDTHRCKVLNTLLLKAVYDLQTSAQLSYELQNLDPEITKVSLARDFSSCRVFWKTSGDAKRDDLIQKTLEKNAAHIRHLIMSQQIMGGVPPIVFLRDKRLAAIAEVDMLLREADFGPDLPEDSPDYRITAAEEAAESPHSSQPVLYGIDHKLLNKQIADWCQQSKTEEHSQAHELQQEQLLAIAEHKKQQIIRKRKRKAPPQDHDITPRDFLLAQQDMATPRGWSQRLEEEEPEEEARLKDLSSLEEKRTL
ncbi:hypothetical protein NHX12_001093 [Muraenolepis orangiensis]|uniref:Ribosome-binding factor A, mitochondrial n=1 Tax=Muraenolepis orangiensis TaxID=630683 RepID=A0A9Q0DZ21_9TELE|nr:hypothetical protein NHX12_001093 [Muraenolepis orangiensis]